jgi:hypothetical protein
MPFGVGLPAAGVDDREATAEPLGLVRDAVARDAGSVFDDGLAAAEDAVDERRLADVRTADDREHRARGQVSDALGSFGSMLEKFEVFIVELVLGETRAERAGALLGDLVVERVETFGELRVELGLEFVVLARGNGDVAVAHLALSSMKSWRSPSRRPPERSARSRGRWSRSW